MKKIIVAVDGSEPAKRALDMAATLAERFDALVTTIHVYTPLYVPPEPFVITDGNLEQSLRDHGETLARDAATVLAKRGVKAEWMLAEGAPGDRIIQAAEERKADLVVVGSRGRSVLGRALLGSVSSHLAHACPIPVLIVR